MIGRGERKKKPGNPHPDSKAQRKSLREEEREEKIARLKSALKENQAVATRRLPHGKRREKNTRIGGAIQGDGGHVTPPRLV